MINCNLGIKDIEKLIPHRYPFLLVDAIKSYVPNERIAGVKNVSFNEWFFQGHFPEQPVMPGVLIVEALAQTAGCLMKLSLSEEQQQQKQLMYFMRIENAVFKKPVMPGDQIELQVEVAQRRSNVAKFTAKAFVAGNIHCEAAFMAMMAPAE